jgi:hypothetical protein
MADDTNGKWKKKSAGPNVDEGSGSKGKSSGGRGAEIGRAHV